MSNLHDELLSVHKIKPGLPWYSGDAEYAEPETIVPATLKHEKRRLAGMLWPAKSRLQPGLAAPQVPPAKEYSTEARICSAERIFKGNAYEREF